MIYISLQSSKNTEDWERVVEFAVKMPESSGSINIRGFQFKLPCYDLKMFYISGNMCES